jgi:FKBP-type peptidyl-prolyl cis-trans isomerase SlyD
MQIAKHTVVALDYTLTAPDGEVLDSSSGGPPLEYVHGIGALVPGLESRLEGKQKGERFEVRVPAAEGYGERDERLVQEVPRSRLPAGLTLELGTQLQARGKDGEMVLTVVKLEAERVTLDGNHPLAGMDLQFAGEIRDVRAATQDELAHGHVHGEGHGH